MLRPQRRGSLAFLWSPATVQPCSFGIAIGLVALLPACSSDGDDDADVDDEESFASSDLVPETLDEILNVASDYQREILANGRVTPEDYERAVIAMLQCAAERGLTVSGPEWRHGGTSLDYSMRIESGSGGDRQEMREISDECRGEYLELVERAWTVQVHPTEEQVQAARAALAQCLRDAGIDMPDEPGREDFNQRLAEGDPAYLEALGPCSEQVSEEFAIPNFSGG